MPSKGYLTRGKGKKKGRAGKIEKKERKSPSIYLPQQKVLGYTFPYNF